MTWLFVIPLIQLHGQNLVLNGSFELYSSCPSFAGQIERASAWNHPLNHEGSADYFHACATSAEVGVPDNAFGSEQPDIGEGYTGLSLIFYPISDFREYIQTRLFKPMEKGVTYEVSFRYSLSDQSSVSTGQLSVAFPEDTPTGAGSWEPILADPVFTVGTPPTSFNGWTKANFTYTANGGEAYLLVGNFNNDANTPTFFAGNLSHQGCYIYLDDFDVTPCATVDLGMDTVLCPGSQFILNAGAQDATYLWQDGSKDSLYTVTKTGIYWVQVSNDCAIVRDTIVVDFIQPAEIIPGQDTVICEDAMFILTLSSNNVLEAIWQDISQGTQYVIDAPGIYWVSITDYCGTYMDTIIVQQEQCERPVYVPNIFSPNGDRINDLFSPVMGCSPVQYQFIVFDRSGNTIFESADPGAPWDGTYKGKPLLPAVYTYALSYISPAGKKHLKAGSIVLVS